MSEIYNRIRMRRQELGWTTDELAKRMGYKDRSSISKIESGKADIPQSKVKAFADVLDTTVSWLLGIDDVAEDFDAKSTKPTLVSLTSQQQTLLASFDQLNEEGQTKAVEYVEDLVMTGRYKKSYSSGVGQKEA